MTIPFTLTDTSLTIVLDCTPHTLPRSHPNWSKLLDALRSGTSTDEIRPLVDVPTTIIDFMRGHLEIKDRVVRYRGQPVDTHLTRQILRFMEADDPALAEPLIAFLDNVMLNPSFRAVQGLHEWAEHSGLPITSDGHLLAWKIVRGDFHDYYSRSFEHRVGSIVEQDRNLCDDDPDRTCSHGLHFCAYDYLPAYQNGDDSRRIMIVKINPRDVVAIPRDYNCAKGRACRYEVVGEVPEAQVRAFFPENTMVYAGFDAADDGYVY